MFDYLCPVLLFTEHDPLPILCHHSSHYKSIINEINFVHTKEINMANSGFAISILIR